MSAGDDLGFAFRVRKNGEIELSRHGRVVTVLRGNAASSFLAAIAAGTPGEAQQAMARATGNYKRGNERLASEQAHARTSSRRRDVLMQALAVAALGTMPSPAPAGEPTDLQPEKRWYEAAAAMERLARSWGDQPYGAVLVADRAIVGNGPSRVVQLGDPTAHAEREAIRDAQRRLGRTDLAGSVLYSTSRPCRACESAAAKAGIRRMFYGPGLSDAGEPQD